MFEHSRIKKKSDSEFHTQATETAAARSGPYEWEREISNRKNENMGIHIARCLRALQRRHKNPTCTHTPNIHMHSHVEKRTEKAWICLNWAIITECLWRHSTKTIILRQMRSPSHTNGYISTVKQIWLFGFLVSWIVLECVNEKNIWMQKNIQFRVNASQMRPPSHTNGYPKRMNNNKWHFSLVYTNKKNLIKYFKFFHQIYS